MRLNCHNVKTLHNSIAVMLRTIFEALGEIGIGCFQLFSKRGRWMVFRHRVNKTRQSLLHTLKASFNDFIHFGGF